MHRTISHLPIRGAALFLGALLLAGLTPATASANAALRLYPDVADGGGGQLVTHTPFMLTVANDGNGGGDNTAYDTQLVVAVNDPGLLTAVTVTFPDLSSVTLTAADLTVGSPVFPCTGRSMPPHGVYPAAYDTVPLGDIAEDGSVELTVDYSGLEGLAVHFDAIAFGLKNNGSCRDVYNPFGHDVTAMLAGGGSDPPECEVEFEKTSDVDQVEIGGQVVFTLTVDTSADCELTAAVITDVIPVVTDPDGNEVPAFSVIATDPVATSVSDTEVVWEIGTITADTSLSFTMTVVFDEEAAEGFQVINAACLTATELDEELCDNTAVAVGGVVPPEPVGGPGFWCRQIRAGLEDLPNARYTYDELEAMLVLINDGSGVFIELRDTNTLDLVRVLLCRPNTLSDAGERLMRHLMTLWFNLVSERLDPALTLGELCAGDEGLPDGADLEWTVGYVRDEAEAALIGGADDQTLSFWKDVIDYINNACKPDDCSTIRRGGRQQRMRP